MNEEPITKDHYLYRLACIPCAELRKQKVELKGIETQPLLTLGAIVLAVLLLLRKE